MRDISNGNVKNNVFVWLPLEKGEISFFEKGSLRENILEVCL